MLHVLMFTSSILFLIFFFFYSFIVLLFISFVTIIKCLSWIFLKYKEFRMEGSMKLVVN